MKLFENMYWYNLRDLEKEIVENKLTDKQAFYYLLAFSIIGVIKMYLGDGNETETYISKIEGIALLGITIWGCYLIFNTNSKGDGKDFFKRFWALSWVVGFRLFTWLFLVIFIYLIVKFVIERNEIQLTTGLSSDLSEGIGELIIGSAFYIIYYVLLRNSFKRVSTSPDSEEA